MADDILDIDTAFTLPIKGVYQGRSWELEFENYSDENYSVPLNWPDGTWIFIVSEDIRGLHVVANLTPLINAHVMTIPVTTLKNILTGGKVYYFNLVHVPQNGTVIQKGQGSIQVSIAMPLPEEQ